MYTKNVEKSLLKKNMSDGFLASFIDKGWGWKYLTFNGPCNCLSLPLTPNSTRSFKYAKIHVIIYLPYDAT